MSKKIVIKWMVFDGLSPMRAFRKNFGDRNNCHRYRDPSTGETIYLLNDPPHLLKRCRNEIFNNDLIAPDGSSFSWSDLRKLVERDVFWKDLSVSRKNPAFNGWKWYIELMVVVKEVFRTADSIASVEDRRSLKLEKLEEQVREWIEKQEKKGGCWNSLLQTDFLDNARCFPELARDLLLRFDVALIPVLLTQDIVEDSSKVNQAPSCVPYKQRYRRQLFMSPELSSRNGAYSTSGASATRVPQLPREVFAELQAHQEKEKKRREETRIVALSERQLYTKGQEQWVFNRIIGWAIQSLILTTREENQFVLRQWLVKHGSLTFVCESSPIHLFCWELVNGTVTNSFCFDILQTRTPSCCILWRMLLNSKTNGNKFRKSCPQTSTSHL
jgi:hypothetical protein